MIIDTLENSAGIEKLHPDFKMVFDYIKKHDLLQAEPGRIELDGDRVYISVAETVGRPLPEALIETHDKYIDVQVLLSGEETFGWKSRGQLKEGKEEYNEQNDIRFYADEAGLLFTLEPGEFVVFFPEDGHAPCIGTGKIRKLVAKVRIL